MPCIVRMSSGGCLSYGQWMVPSFFLDSLGRVEEVLKEAKLPKAAATIAAFSKEAESFPANGKVSMWGRNYGVRDIMENPMDAVKREDEENARGNRGYSSFDLPAKGFESLPIVQLGGKSQKESLLSVTEDSLRKDLAMAAELFKLAKKVEKIMQEKMDILSAKVPEAYGWSLDREYGRYANGRQPVVGAKWSPRNKFDADALSVAARVLDKGFEMEMVNDEAESFAVARSFAIFSPQRGAFMDKKGYLSATLSDACLFEDVAAAKRSRGAHRLSKSSFICEVEVRAKKIALNDANLPEGDFAAATVVAERAALEEMLRNRDAQEMAEENERLRIAAGEASRQGKPSGGSL